MKIVAVLGSPRPRASSGKLVNLFLNSAAERGADSETFLLNDLHYIGCQGCYGCKRVSDTCVIKDDLTPVLMAVSQCDILIIATPIYVSDVTGQMKCFIDRTFSFLSPELHTKPAQASRLEPGKKMLFMQTQGSGDSREFADVFPRYEKFFRLLGFAAQSLIVAGVGLQENVLESRPELTLKIKELAHQMLG
jgi:multimeric flavodoxin WrbA